jgi:hypothetical protein
MPTQSPPRLPLLPLSLYHQNPNSLPTLDAVTGPVTNKVPTTTPFTVILPNGEAITSTHTAELDLGNIPLGARTCHLFPHLRSGSLLSIGQLCDHG